MRDTEGFRKKRITHKGSHRFHMPSVEAVIWKKPGLDSTCWSGRDSQRDKRHLGLSLVIQMIAVIWGSLFYKEDTSVGNTILDSSLGYEFQGFTTYQVVDTSPGMPPRSRQPAKPATCTSELASPAHEVELTATWAKGQPWLLVANNSWPHHNRGAHVAHIEDASRHIVLITRRKGLHTCLLHKDTSSTLEM